MRHARFLAAALAFTSTLLAQSVPTVLNYQGRLTDNTPSQAPINAVVNMQFEIWDVPAGGNVGVNRLWAEPAAGSYPVLVTNGIFNVQLGGNGVALPPSLFSGGTARYLQILANAELLTPRQKISATAYAGQAENAAAAATFTGSLAGDVTGTQGATTVASLRGVPVAPIAPSGGQQLTYSAGNSRWEPGSGPYPVSCGTGEVIMSSGPSAWRCGLICANPLADCDLNTGNGCEVNINTSPANCGGCSQACSGNNVPAPACAGGGCSGLCAAGFGDCNADLRTDGCEVNTTNSTTYCGGCARGCSSANVSGALSCSGGLCNTTACNPNFGNCNQPPHPAGDDGCETNTTNNVNNCNGCGVICSVANGTAGCVTSACVVSACNAPFADCDGQYATGCEINTSNDPNHCGNCPTVCAGGASCVSGLCKKLNGQVCGVPSECQSNFCVDGVCCNANCGNSCDACNLAGNIGVCTNRTVGSTGSPSCSPYFCSGTAICSSTCSGDSQCVAGFYCNGSSLCVPKLAQGATCSTNNSCSSNNCVDNVCCNTSCGSLCQACSTAKTGGANGTCTNIPAFTDPDNECAGATSCNGAGACLLANGASCGAPTQCQSNFCTDTVCCNSSCSGLCQTCTSGSCTFIPASTDPDNECAGAMNCNGAGACI